MTRPEEIALSYATGQEPSFTVDEMVACLEDFAAEEGIAQDRADLLIQAARRLTVTMTGLEIQARLNEITASCGAKHAHSEVYSFNSVNPIDVTIWFGEGIERIRSKGTDWTAVLDDLAAKAASGQWAEKIITGLAKTLLSGGKLSDADEARFGDKARARSREMARAFTQSQVEG